MRIIREARQSRIPEFIPTNYFWGNNGLKITNVKVVDPETGQTLEIPTANFMQDRVVKSTVAAPAGYFIPAEFANKFKLLLEWHNIAYEILDQAQKFPVEQCRLLCAEDFWDPVYNRYA